MKIKDLQGFPEKKVFPDCPDCGCRNEECNDDTNSDSCIYEGDVGYNQALSELGELEVELDVEKIKKFFTRFAQECWLKDVYTQEQAEKCFDDKIATAIANSNEVVRIKGEI